MLWDHLKSYSMLDDFPSCDFMNIYINWFIYSYLCYQQIAYKLYIIRTINMRIYVYESYKIENTSRGRQHKEPKGKRRI